MPSSLLHSSAHVLEFESLRDLIRGYASSPLGEERIAALAPSVDRPWIENQHQLTNEIREFRRVGGHFEFSGLLEMHQAGRKGPHSRARSSKLPRFVTLCWSSIAPANGGGIALGPPAAMKVPWVGSGGTFIRHRRLQRLPSPVPQQNSTRWHARRPRLAGTGPHPPRNRKAEEDNPAITARLSAPLGGRRCRAG